MTSPGGSAPMGAEFAAAISRRTGSALVAANGGRVMYRATVAHRACRQRARRPKPAKLAANHRLREVVEEKLELWWSPHQISTWLTQAYPDDEEMRVSPESISQSLSSSRAEAPYARSCGAVCAPRERSDGPGDVRRRPRARSGKWS